jgi:predicted DsbA family dithiol-disulfide isomerase
VELTWRSFQLDPDASPVPAGGYVGHLARKYGRSTAEAQQMVDDITAHAAGEGLEFRLDISRSGNTFNAHRLLHLAKDRGVQDPLKERLDRAYFTEGEPVDDAGVLTRLAVEVGLDEAEVAEVLSSARYAEAVNADIAEARALGINGVPFFVVDRRYGISGAQPAELITQALTQAWGDQSLTVLADAPTCADEACEV